MQVLVAFFRGEYASGALGVFAALALLALVRALLPKAEQDRSRIAAIYVVLAISFGVADWFAPDGGAIERTIEFFFWFFVLASCGRSLVLLAVDVVFGRKTHRSAPRIFRDLTQAVVYVIVLLLTLRAIGVEPGSLLTTSALLTAVVGLALQDTLGNLVSGLALQMQRPFEVGDWIQFDSEARQIGQVTEVNWRATTVMTSDLVEVIVPNAMLAKAAIRNYSRPSKVSRRFVSVQGPYDASPHRVQDAIARALVGVPGLLTEPAPWVQTKTFADSGIEYTVWFFIDDYASRERTDGLVRDRVWYAMQRAKLAIPYPIRTVHVHQESEESRRSAYDRELDRRDKILRCVDFLDVLPDATHRALAAAAEIRLFAPGEVIVTEGETSAEMFIIDTGQVAVEILRAGRAMAVARLGPGKFFGEMGLMTGEVRRATVRALSECEVIVVGRDAFQRTIASVPDVVEKMSSLLAVRQAELEAVADQRPSIEPMQARSQRLISQIKGFFKL
ncbi:MAG TPA: mechanosensitive ion channel family protein [Labilithrix sp.]|nr:mechanosensitive ion channel family protein [Labilithrix sp.]